MLAARRAGSLRLEEHAIPLARAVCVILGRFEKVLVDSHGVFSSPYEQSF
jgi:hypothetical protein